MLIGERPQVSGHDVFAIAPRLYTDEQACVYTGRTKKQLERAISKGWITRCQARDGKTGIKREDLDAFLGVKPVTD